MTINTQQTFWQNAATCFFATLAILFTFNIAQAQDLILDTQNEVLPKNNIQQDTKQAFQFLRKSQQDARVLSLDLQLDVHTELFAERPDYLELAVPVDATHHIILELEKKEILAPNFRLTTSSGEELAFNSVSTRTHLFCIFIAIFSSYFSFQNPSITTAIKGF